MMKWLLPVGAVAAVVYYGVEAMRDREEATKSPEPALMTSSDPKINAIIENALTPEEKARLLEDKTFLDNVVGYTASR